MAGMADVLAKTTGKSTGVSSAFRSKAASRGQQIILAGEVNDTLKRIQETKNVIGTMVINHDGIPIKSSIDTSVTAQYSGLLARFTQRAMQTVRAMDPGNELEYLRVSSKHNEILIAPDDNFTLVVMQAHTLLNPPEKEKEGSEINFRV